MYELSTPVSYGYDTAGRLTSESRSGTNPYSKSYTLDGVGNRTSQAVGGTTTSFTLNSDDELTATSGGFSNSYNYNYNGEQTGRTLSGTSYTLAYDYDGQPTSITQGSAVVSFTYDALGRRLTRSAGGTTTQFLSSSGSQIYLEAVGGTVTAAYGYGNELIHKGGEYPMFDGLGSERTVTNSSQTVTGTLNLDAFGNLAGSTGSSTNPYMYAATSGYRNDGDAGLVHVGARYYDAQVGRFTSRDTVLTEHPYLYCDHDPVDGVDPSGHDWYYHQNSGSMTRHVGNQVYYVGSGYSGAPGHVNVPGDDNLSGLGPIPSGDYTIGDPQNSGHMGNYHLALAPDPGNDMHNRSGFFIHGDNSRHNNSASEGCIILPLGIRQRIHNSGDNSLHVLP